jgi:hypothetical protein
MITGVIEDKFKLLMIAFVICVCGLAYFQYNKIIELSATLSTQQTLLENQSKAIDKAVSDITNIINLNAEADRRISIIQENFKKQSATINELRGGKLNDLASKDKTIVESGINFTVNDIMQSISTASGNKN